MSAAHRPPRGVQWGLEGVTVSAVRAWAPFVAPVSALLGLAGLFTVATAALVSLEAPDPGLVYRLTRHEVTQCFDGHVSARCANLLEIENELVPDFRAWAAMRVPMLPPPPRPLPEGSVATAGSWVSPFTIDPSARPAPDWTPPKGDRWRLDVEWEQVRQNPVQLAEATGAVVTEVRRERARVAADAQQLLREAGLLGLLGTLALFGAFAVWLLPRRTELYLGLNGVRIDGWAVPLDALTRLRRVGSRLVLDTEEGVVRSPALLAPALLDDAIDALARLPTPEPGKMSADAERLRSLLAHTDPSRRRDQA